MQFIGIDPDTKVLSMAGVGHTGALVWVSCSVLNHKLTGLRSAEEAIHNISMGCRADGHVVIEAQDVRYTTRKTNANPQSLVHLALVAGAWAGVARDPFLETHLVYPQEWKGSVKKIIKQRRIWTHLGIEYTEAGGKNPYTIPILPDTVSVYGKFPKSAWADITDSVGLAVYAHKTYGGKA